MPFPATAVLDAFSGTNGADLPVYSANWGSVTGIPTLEIQDSAAAGTGAFQEHLNYWAAADYGPDCEAYVSINAIAGVALVAARLAQQTSSSTLDGYVVQANSFFASLFVQRYDNGVLTQLGAGISQTLGAGDKVGIEVVGSTITAYYNDSGGGWTNKGSRNDSTYTAAGKIGLGAGHSSDRLDNFGGGTISSAQTVAVGQASETDTAQAIAAAKLRQISQASSSEVAQPFHALKARPLQQAQQQEQALPIRAVKVRSVGMAIEQASAEPTAWAPKHRLVGLALDSESALSITPAGGEPPAEPEQPQRYGGRRLRKREGEELAERVRKQWDVLEARRKAQAERAQRAVERLERAGRRRPEPVLRVRRAPEQPAVSLEEVTNAVLERARATARAKVEQAQAEAEEGVLLLLMAAVADDD